MSRAPIRVSVQDVTGTWRSYDAPADTDWTTSAPGGCVTANIPLVAQQPDLARLMQHGCAVRVSSGDTGGVLWSGRVSSPVRRIMGSLETADIAYEGTAGLLADRYLRYAPIVSRDDAWHKGSDDLKRYRGGSTVSGDDGLVLALPSNWLASGDRVIATFHGMWDSNMNPYAIRGRHSDGVFTNSHTELRSSFFPFLWNGQPDGTVQWIGDPGDTEANSNNLMQQYVSADKDTDIVLGYQFSGPRITVGDDTKDKDGNYTGAGHDYNDFDMQSKWYGLQVFAVLLNADGSQNNYNPFSGSNDIGIHDVINDLIGRNMVKQIARNPVTSAVSTKSGVRIGELDYSDRLSYADILNDMVDMDPRFYWYVGPADAGNGEVGLQWQPWADARRLLMPPGAVQYTSESSDRGLANAVTVTYQRTENYNSTQVVRASMWDYPDIAHLDGQTLEAPPLKLDMTEKHALQVANAYLAAYATLPRAATATLDTYAVDAQSGALVPPWEMRAGMLAFVPETGETLRITKCTCKADGTAELTLGNPRRTPDQIVATMGRRRAKRN